jgi:hypothetical protein
MRRFCQAFVVEHHVAGNAAFFRGVLLLSYRAGQWRDHRSGECEQAVQTDCALFHQQMFP